MSIREIQARSILRKHKRIDSWFISCYGMNLYRGCLHNCLYCDGRAEKYQVDGEFGQDIAVKTNALEILARELDPARKRKPMPKSYLLVGGGVGDGYQPVEEKYQLTRKTLELLTRFSYPIHILTKSTLVERDLDLIKKINQQSRAVVSFSISSTSKEISRQFEPGVPSPEERLQSIKFFKKHNIACGMFLMPVIPFITDKPDIMEQSLKDARQAGIDFIIFSGMTLKPGQQQDYFYAHLQHYYPHLLIEYQNIYKGDQWGQATAEYYQSLHQTFYALIKKYRLPVRIPLALFKDILDENNRVSILLEHMDYMLKLQGKPSPYSYAAYSISQLKQPLNAIRNDLQKLKGVGPTTEKIIREILDTGTSAYYEKLINYQ